MNCHGTNCNLKDTCRRFTHPVAGDPFYALSPVWNEGNECNFHLKSETAEERLEAFNEERRERFKQQLS